MSKYAWRWLWLLLALFGLVMQFAAGTVNGGLFLSLPLIVSLTSWARSVEGERS